MPNCPVGPSECETKFSLKHFGMGYVKMHNFHGNPIYMILENWGRPTNSIIFTVLLILEHYNWCQIKAKTHVFFPVVRFVNNLICSFMNIDENLKKMSKIVKKHINEQFGMNLKGPRSAG